MKIAVTYDNGNVFQHFGRTEAFKIYEIENNEIISENILDTDGTGHEALAYLLADEDINVLICGGLGAGAQAALSDADIEVFSGASGNTDEAVRAYLAGELKSSGVNCDHHDHHEEEHGCGGGCGGHCGGGCGGCHQPDFDGPNVGKVVRTHYRGTFDDGTQFDSSYDRGEPLEFTCGAGMMIHGFDKAVANMKIGETIQVHLTPDEAYGMPNPNAIFTAPIDQMPGAENLTLGQHVYLQDAYGNPIPVTVTAIVDGNITFDANHEMAGKELNFQIELVDVK